MKNVTSVIRGSMKNKKIPAPANVHGHTHRTSQKLKEALFQIIENHFSNLNEVIFWDIYAGSGQIGIEAISRGFKYIVFCEQNPQRYSKLTQWLNKNHCDTVSRTTRSDARRALEKAIKDHPCSWKVPLPFFCDSLIVFLDPPYSFFHSHYLSHFKNKKENIMTNDPIQRSLNMINRLNSNYLSDKSIYQKILICLQAPYYFYDEENIFDKAYHYDKNKIFIKFVQRKSHNPMSTQ